MHSTNHRLMFLHKFRIICLKEVDYMNPEKTGAFIAEQRKQKQMTQKNLATKIGVTDKAISRWETGKGYPDIEIMPSLAEALSVTLTELLNGEAVTKEQLITVADTNLSYVCNKALQKRKRYIRCIIAISVIAFIIFAILIALNIFLTNKSKDLMGSNNCIVANDYSYITYYNEKYIPLNTGYLTYKIRPESGAYDCVLGEKSVYEVKVDGSTLLYKMLFGESLYSVKGVVDDDIVFLETDYDDLSTQYYVKESKYDYYNQMLSGAQPIDYYVRIEQKDMNTKNVAISNSIVQAIKEAEKGDVDTTVKNGTNRSNGEEYLPVLAFEENHIFYQIQGELLYKNGKYYWYGYHGLPDYSSHPYLIDESYYNELNKLFSYLYE